MRPIKAFILLAAVVLMSLLHACGGSTSTTDRARLDALDSTFEQVDSLERMESLVDSLSKTGDEPATMMALKRLGKLYRNNSRFPDAIDAHDKEFDFAYQMKDTIEMVRALNNIGTNFRRMGILEEATSYHYQALGYCDRYSHQDDPVMQKNRVVSLNGIGNIYMTMGNYASADTALRMALAGERQLGSELGQAINLANIGSILEHQGQIDSAWIYYRQSLEMNKRAGSDLGISLCHTHFGELYEDAGQLDQAINEYTQAYDIMHRNSDTWHWMESCVALARVHIKNGDLPQAQHYIRLTDSIANSINSLEHKVSALRLKYQLASRRGNSGQALDYFVQATSLEDSLQANGNSAQVQNARINYERERRQAEFDLINQNYANERRVKNIFIFAAILLVLLGTIAIAFLLFTLRARRRAELLRQQVEQMRTQFFTNVTHEFRTPLTVIMGLSKQLQTTGKDTSPEEIQHQAGIIHRQGSNLLQLINQLLDISRVKSEIGDPEWRTGNVVTYIDMLVEGYRVLAEQKGVSIQFAAQPDQIEMDFPPYYMRRIVSNLVGNSLKFTSPGDEIRITCSLSDDNQFQLIVADTGRGIAPDDLPHIFETFYVGKAVGHGDMSTGVGLSLIHQIVSAMEGNITVHSDEGKGTVFTVDLPLKHGSGQWNAVEATGDIEAVAIGQVETTVTDAAQTDDDDASCRVLIVEDHNDVAYYIGEQLREGYRVYYAQNGQEALAKAEDIVPDLVITDLMMPEMDGYELCRRVRQHPVLNHIPVIIVTARCSEEDRLRGYEVGADAYLEKPFNPEELRLRVSGLMAQRQQLREHFLHQLSDQAATGAATTGDITDTAEATPASTSPSTRQEAQANETPSPQITAGEREFIQRFVQLVDEAISAHNVDMESLASQLNMTSTQLRRKVHAITGKTPLAYANEVRLMRASQLLHTQPDLSVSDIADQCGYEDISYFSRQFKQRFGVTPSQFRNTK